MVFQAHFLVFHGTPQALDEEVVIHPAIAIHVDARPCLLWVARELPARKLSALIAVQDLRPAMRERLLDRLHPEGNIQRVR